MNITIQRHYNGIGDHLMALACIKYVNRQRPDVKVHVDFEHIKVGRLPALVPSLYEASDCIYLDGFAADGPVTRDSLVYRKWPPELYIESMVDHLNDQTGLDIRYEHGVYPSFGVAWTQGRHVVMVGQGKRRERRGKEWGHTNFVELARLLDRAGVEVVQIGSSFDSPIYAAKRRVLGGSAAAVLEALCSARAFVGLENGLMMLAGFIGIPQATIYDGASHPQRVSFPRHLKLVERIEPDEAAAKIMAWLEDGTR